MPRSEDELAEALAQSEAWMDAVNPDEVPEDAVNDRKDLRQIGMALISMEVAEQALVSAVANARANKRSWTDIANVLGVSRQAARQRFDDRVTASDCDASIRLWGDPSVGSGFFILTCHAASGYTDSQIRKKLRTRLQGSDLNELADLVKAAQEEQKRR